MHGTDVSTIKKDSQKTAVPTIKLRCDDIMKYVRIKRKRKRKRKKKKKVLLCLKLRNETFRAREIDRPSPPPVSCDSPRFRASDRLRVHVSIENPIMSHVGD
ncbi:hypothetical protein PUN28_013038 [Cardiocondyla obscurior]|uniref:Uncharacterized protein n=1 Tax=Cardiocondyla obscurior TaxID=286306 RepID=A0AAW2F7X1_9HYME